MCTCDWLIADYYNSLVRSLRALIDVLRAILDIGDRLATFIGVPRLPRSTTRHRCCGEQHQCWGQEHFCGRFRATLFSHWLARRSSLYSCSGRGNLFPPHSPRAPVRAWNLWKDIGVTSQSRPCIHGLDRFGLMVIFTAWMALSSPGVIGIVSVKFDQFDITVEQITLIFGWYSTQGTVLRIQYSGNLIFTFYPSTVVCLSTVRTVDTFSHFH